MNPLNAETLTALSTTSSQNLTAAFGGHASTEAVAFGTLTSVRLISALHIVSLSWLSATRQVYIGGNCFSKLNAKKDLIRAVAHKILTFAQVAPQESGVRS